MQKMLIALLFVLSIGVMAEGVLDPSLLQAMENNRGEKLQVMITLKDTVDAENLMATHMVRGENAKEQLFGLMQNQCADSQHFLKGLINNMCNSGRAESMTCFWLANAIAVKADAAVIRELALQPNVQCISLDAEQVMISPMVADETRSLWGLDRIKSKEVNGKGFSGQGVTVVVTDTGINLSHPAFSSGQIIQAKCKSFVSGESTVEDGHGHGTHCAGTIASPQYGVAPQAKIIGVKVLSAGGSGTWQGVQQGVEYGATVGDVISMSLGGSASPSGNVVETAVKNAINSGVVVVIAAGNSGPGSKTIGTPGVTKEAITVGAIQQGDGLASFSSRGPTVYGDAKPDIVAPGVGVLSAWKNGGTNTISGTSMATPHVAGLCALILSKNKNLTPAQVKSIIMANAEGTKQSNTFGEGVVNCVKALNATN